MPDHAQGRATHVHDGVPGRAQREMAFQAVAAPGAVAAPAAAQAVPAAAAAVAWTPPATTLRVLEAELDIVPAAGGRRSAVLHRMLAAADVAAGAMAPLLVAMALGVPVHLALVLAAALALAWPAATFVCGLYAPADLRSWLTGVPDVRRLIFVALALSWPLSALAGVIGTPHPIRAALVTMAAALLLNLGLRATARAVAHQSENLRERTLIVGSGVVAAQIAGRLRQQTAAGLVPIGVVDDEVHPDVGLGVPCLGSLDDLPAVLSRHGVDRVIIAFSRASHEQLLSAIRSCRDRRVPVHVVPRLYEFLDGARELDQVGGMPMLSLGVPRLSRTSRAAKRGLDIAGASIALLVLAPLMALIALAIRFESGGSVIFRQVRAGRGDTEFELLKFRSMYDGADARKAELMALNEHADGIMFKIRADPRITRVGGILRRFSLDELPQFVNVLRGEMSLVGPRPLVLAETAALGEQWHRRRRDLRPGLTGPWQVYGRSDLSFGDMVRLDYQYVAGWSLARDMEILLATFPAIVSGRGAY